MKATAQAPKQGQPPAQVAAAPFRRRTKHWREPFNAAGTYVWARALMVSGNRVVPGSPVDKSSLPMGRLRRLWQIGVVQRTDWSLRPKPAPVAEGAA